MWETIWKILVEPPNKPEIPFLESGLDHLNSMTASWLSRQVMEVTRWITVLLLHTPTAFLESEPFQQVYGFMSTLAFGLTVPAIMWVGFQAIRGATTVEEGINQAIRFTLVPIGVHLLPRMVLLSLNLFNNLTRLVLDTSPIPPERALNPGVFSVTLILFLGLYVWLSIQLVRYYCYRNFALVVLVAFAPILFLTWAVDRGTRLTKWRDELIGLMTTQVVHALELVILVTMTVGAGSVADSGIPIIAIQVGALTFMVKTPEWLSGYIQTLPDWFPLRQPRLPSVTWTELMRRARGVFKP